MIIYLFLLLVSISCRYGVDITQSYTDSTFSCFAQQSIGFLVAQAYLPYGGPNPNAAQNLRMAKNRGLSTDIYMNVCVAKDAATQVNDMLNNIPDNMFDTVWIRVEQNFSPGCSFSSNAPQWNCDYIRGLAGAIMARGAKVGIYSTIAYWKQIFQSSTFCYQLANYPLWYGSDDGSASFNSYGAFGGWMTPSLKTYNYQTTLCGTTINMDYKP